MQIKWQSGPIFPSLEPGEIHLWRLPLYCRPEEMEVYRPLLGSAEVGRAERFHFERDRRRFIMRRGMLRKILSSYIGCPPETIRIKEGPQGKPSIAGPAGAAALQFNLSHSEELALIILARDRMVGVDVECIRPELRWEQIASRFFSPEEQDYLQKQDEDQRLQSFLALWTRKEAWVKCRGETLAPHLSHCLLPEHQPASRQSGRWSFWTLRPGPGYIGTVCAEGKKLELRCFNPVF